MKNIISIAIILIASSIFMKAQDTNEKRRYIEVTGSAELEVVPDEIYLSITLRESDTKDRYSIDELERKMVQKLTDIGVDIENLYIAGAKSNLVKAFWKGKKIYAQKNYTLKLTKAETVGRVLEGLEEIGISNIYIQRVDHSEKEKFRKEVKVMAVKAAKEKADYLLEAIGEKTGKPIFILERNYSAPRTFNRASNTMMEAGMMKAKPAYDLDFQEMLLRYEIFARFEIE